MSRGWIIGGALALALSGPVLAQDPQIGRWTVHVDAHGATATAVSVNRMPVTTGEADRTVLTVGCYGGQPIAIGVDLRAPLHHTGPTPVTWRFDHGPAQTQPWSSEALDNVHFPDQRDRVGFLGHLQTAGTLTLTVAGSRSRSRFDLSGGSRAIPQVLAACRGSR